MKNNRMYLILALVLLFSMISCAPAVVPTAVPQTRATPLPTVTASASVADDIAWIKVVQAAKKEGRVTAYSFNYVGDIGIALAQAFENKYNIKLDIVTGMGGAFLERIKVEKRMRQVAGDFTEGSLVNLVNMKAEDLLVSIYGELPVVKESGVWQVEPAASDPQDKIILTESPVYLNPFVNTNLVKPGEEPKSFTDFLDPKWQGKLSIADPAVGPGAFQWVVPLLDSGIINEDYLLALGRQKLRFFQSPIDDMRALARGEVNASIRGVDSAAAIIVREGAPIKAIALNEGTVVVTTGITAIAGGPHPNAAKLFINWLLSKEGQTIYGKAQGLAAARKDVPDFRPDGVKAADVRLIVVSPEQQVKAARLFREKWLVKFWGR